MELARGCLGQCVSYPMNMELSSSSMFSGLAGWGLELLRFQWGQGYQKLIKTITGGVIEASKKELQRSVRAVGTHCLFMIRWKGSAGC